MAIKIAITNQKGGVGKTTTAINIADGFRHIGYKVLFLDLDPQCNSTSTYGGEYENENTIVDVLKKDCTAEEAVQKTPLGDIIPGDPLLAQEESFFNEQRARETLLKRALRSIDENYDIIVMDTPPNLGIYMTNALTAANGCVIPMNSQKYAIDGLNALISTINEITELLNPDLKVYGVILDMYDKRNALDKDIFAALPEIGKEKGFHVFQTPVRISQEVKKVQSIMDTKAEDGSIVKSNRSLFDNYGSCNAALDYVSVVKELDEEVHNG